MPTRGVPSSDGPHPWEPVPAFAAPSVETEATVREVWRRLDDAAAAAGGMACRACGSCCDFPRTDHVLFATRVELDVLLAWAASRDLLGAAAREALASGLCPFWRDRRCVAREVRPTGCRAYHCDRDMTQKMHEMSEAARRQLAGAGASHPGGWWYGPALVYLSRQMSDGRLLTGCRSSM